jgi:hypothetical protein
MLIVTRSMNPPRLTRVRGFHENIIQTFFADPQEGVLAQAQAQPSSQSAPTLARTPASHGTSYDDGYAIEITLLVAAVLVVIVLKQLLFWLLLLIVSGWARKTDRVDHALLGIAEKIRSKWASTL